MCMTTESGRVGSNASLVMSDISERFSSSFSAPTSPRTHLRDEVDRRDDLDLAGVGIERVFAGQHGIFPDAAAAVQDKFAMAVLFAGDVGGLRSGIKDHHADIADRNHGLVNGLDGGE